MIAARLCSRPFSRSFASLGRVETKLKAMGHTMPPLPTPAGNYMNWTRSGNLVFLAGHLPKLPDGTLIKGRLGENVTIEEGQKYVI